MSQDFIHRGQGGADSCDGNKRFWPSCNRYYYKVAGAPCGSVPGTTSRTIYGL